MAGAISGMVIVAGLTPATVASAGQEFALLAGARMLRQRPIARQDN